MSFAFVVPVVLGHGAHFALKSASSGRRGRRSPGIVPVEHGRAPAIRTVAGVVAQSTQLSEKKAHTMKKLLAAALLSVAAIALSTAPASAWCCCHKYKFCACAAQYNAFTPFSLNTVYGGHCCCKCFHVAELPCCPPPCCPPPCCPGPCDGGCCGPASYCNGGDAGALGMLPAPESPAAGAAVQGAPATQTPAPAPLPETPAANSSYRWPVRMQQPMVQPAGYRPAYYPGYNYGYRSMMPNGYGYQPQMANGYGYPPQMANGYGYQPTMQMGNVPSYWNGGN